MDDKEKDYYIPEQLDDSDFEKEKLEEKKARKGKKNEFNKKQIVKFFSIIIIIALIGFGVYLYLNPVQKKASAPEQAVKDFCTNFNDKNWKRINELMDFKGYYVLKQVLEEEKYTKFDIAYKEIKNDEKYIEFEKNMNILKSNNEEDLNNYSNTQIKINKIEACNLIQGTSTLYKLRVNIGYIYNGQIDNATSVVYVSNASGEYKIVYGELFETLLDYYKSVFIMNYNYNN